MSLIYGFIFTSIIGTIGHFIYDIADKHPLIGFFFAKDESVWSHLKIGITPMLFWSIVERVEFNNIPNYFAIKGYAILVFCLVIIIPYYTVKLVLKKDYAIFNIILFYIAILFSYVTTFLLINMIYLPFIIKLIGYLIIFFTIFLYFYTEIVKPNYLIFKRFKKEVKD